MISQSGGNASDLGRMASVRGLRFSTVVSYGNAADINETELLQFLGRDPKTKVIGAFIEGVRDMDAFHQTLAEVSRSKPVVILKGGTGEAGSRAVAAHTGAPAAREAWQAVWAQTKAVPVTDMEELMDVLLACQSVATPAGRNVGVVGIGGGDARWCRRGCGDWRARPAQGRARRGVLRPARGGAGSARTGSSRTSSPNHSPPAARPAGSGCEPAAGSSSSGSARR